MVSLRWTPLSSALPWWLFSLAVSNLYWNSDHSTLKAYRYSKSHCLYSCKQTKESVALLKKVWINTLRSVACLFILLSRSFFLGKKASPCEHLHTQRGNAGVWRRVCVLYSVSTYACVFTALLGEGFDLPRMKTAVLVDTVLEVEKVGLNAKTHIHVRVRPSEKTLSRLFLPDRDSSPSPLTLRCCTQRPQLTRKMAGFKPAHVIQMFSVLQ